MNDDSSVEISLEDIVSMDDYENVKKNLYCAFQGCDCKMEYIPKGKGIAYFKTWPLKNHSTDCIDYFLREEKKKSQRSLATTTIGLTDKHITNVLKRLANSVDETEEEKELRLKKQRDKSKQKKRKIIDTSESPELGENIIPSTDKNAEVTGEGTRAPSVKSRFSIFDLSEDDIKTALALHEKIESINIKEKRVIITLHKKNKRTNVYLEESFFSSSARNIDSMLKVVEIALAKGDPLSLECVGNIDRRAGELCILVNGQNHLWINKKPIAVFTFNYSRPNLL